MSIYNLGRVLPIFTGEYDNNKTYNNLDVVLYNGSSYVALNQTQANLPTDTNHWAIVALAGTIAPEQVEYIQEQVIEYVQSQGYVIDSDYTHTDNNFTNAEKAKLDGIDLSTKQDTLQSGINIKTINGNNILGSGNIEIEGVSDYEELNNKPSINGTTLEGNVNLATTEQLNSKQDILVSGTNIKTINNQPILGSGNIDMEAVNHFKGWFDNLTSLQTIIPVIGDYGYVKGATTTDPVKIYECTTNGSWSDSGIEVDTSNVQSFESGESVNSVSIINDSTTGGEHDVLSAQQGKLLSKTINTGFIKPTDITDSANVGKYIYYSSGEIFTGSASSVRRFETYAVTEGQLFLIDCYSLPTSAATIAFYNTETIGFDSYMKDFAIIGRSLPEHFAIIVPKGAVRIVICSSKSSTANQYPYNVRCSETGYSINKYVGLDEIESNANEGKLVYDNLKYGHYRVGEPITETNVFSQIYISNNNRITENTNSVWKIYCYPTSSEDRWLYVDEFLKGSSSIPTGGVYLIDNLSFIAAGNTIPSEDVLNAGSTQSNRVLQKSFFVPANRILVVTHSTYNSNSFLNVYETEFSSKVIDDLQDNAINTINNTLSVDAIPSSTNPLAFVKETPGYTSIFRKMGVIGGSMSTGWHSHNTGRKNMPEYSFLQFMARTCGSEGHNFSRGGISAKSWPQSDMMENFYDTNKKCQMYLVQLGNNDLSDHNNRLDCITKTWYDLNWDGHDTEHGKTYESYYNKVIQNGKTQNDWDAATQAQRLVWIGGPYNLGTIADLTPTGGTSISDYTYNTDTFYGNMARIINEIRKIQPRAYVFLSTFLKGYGSSPDGQPGGVFDYNGAIRNIVEYYTANDGANRPFGDELHYYLIDIYKYGQPYSFYDKGIHTGTSIGSHLVATGYNYWAYEFCTYIDWIIKNNMCDFNDVALNAY